MSTRRFRIGAGFLGHLSSENGFAVLREAARICEEAGMDSFWVADQRWMRDVYVSLADLAARTRRLLLGTRVTDPYVRHPGLTAVAIASLDEASGGRAIMGIGAGGSGFSQMGLARPRPAVAVREAIEVIRRLWAGEEFEFHGRIVDWGRGRLEFRCRPDIPVAIAARGPMLLQLAGEVADAAIVASGVSRGGVAWARERITRGERRAGRRPGSVELMHMTYLTIHRDRRRARQAVKRGIVGAVAGSHPTYDFLAANGLEIPPDLYAYLETGARDPVRIQELIPDGFVDRLAIAGTPEECGEQLAALIESGIDHPLLSPIPVEPGGELEMLRTVATSILPGLRQARTA
ncbi:MAG TPA: LLM class flavin-dependent oxidoreductase [Candidatus Dormibacteraeota bacterium]|jgi:5,10-methylenetetrahydromethanopterin reductase|nr:LLM class flavin-dependent oxidoreductase [Candidatus Dormibacteraeota bacterium]